MMLTKHISIVNKLGLHARAAAKLVHLASRFASDIKVIKDDKTVNGKSIMGVMLLAANKGTQLELIIAGEDEEDAMREIEALISNRFGESE